MLKISHSLQEYKILLGLVSLVLCAQIKATSTFETHSPRPTNEQTKKLKQTTERAPSSVHSPFSPTERSQRPNTLESSPSKNPENNRNQSPSAFPGRPLRAPSVLESTLKGTAEKLIGNFSLSRGDSRKVAETVPLKTRIHIYKGKVKSSGNPILFALSNGPKVFSVVSSDETGHFQVQLPPGEYTLFIELEDGKLYRDSFDGKGYFSTVTLSDGQDTVETLTDLREATF